MWKKKTHLAYSIKEVRKSTHRKSQCGRKIWYLDDEDKKRRNASRTWDFQETRRSCRQSSLLSAKTVQWRDYYISSLLRCYLSSCPLQLWTSSWRLLISSSFPSVEEFFGNRIYYHEIGDIIIFSRQRIQ